MRSFIGLDLAPQQKLALASWQERALPEVSSAPKLPGHPRAVPMANYHMTLCFLGTITPHQRDTLVQQLSDITIPAFSVALDHTGFWQGPKILYTAPSAPSEALTTLAKACRQAARRANITVDNKPYRPHVTMVRKASASMPPPLFQPEVLCEFTQFHLFESMSTSNGVTYPIRGSWQCVPSLSARERVLRSTSD